MPNRIAIYTAASPLYQPQLRVLARSVARYAREIPFIVLSGGGDPSRSWADILPEAFKTYDQIIVLDADTELFSSPAGLFYTISSYDFVAVPHLCTPISYTGYHPNEISCYTGGLLNSGFQYWHNSPNTLSILSWLRDRLPRAPGTFNYNHWCSQIPTLFDNCLSWRTKQWNVAYWNAHAYNLTYDRVYQTYSTDDGPLGLFHYSGFIPTEPERLSGYQSRYAASPPGGGGDPAAGGLPEPMSEAVLQLCRD